MLDCVENVQCLAVTLVILAITVGQVLPIELPGFWRRFSSHTAMVGGDHCAITLVFVLLLVPVCLPPWLMLQRGRLFFVL